MIRMELKEGTSVFTSGGNEVGKINRVVLDPATNEVTHIVVQKGWLFSEDKVVPFDMVNFATEDKVIVSENIDSFDQLPPFEETHYIRAREADVSRGGNPRYVVERPSPPEAMHRDETVEADVSRGGTPRHEVEQPPRSEGMHRDETVEADVSRGGMPRYEAEQPPRSKAMHRDETMEADVSRGGAPRYGAMPAYYWYPPHGYMGYPMGFYGWPPIETTRNIPGHTIPLKEGTDVMSSEGEHVGDIERLFVASDSNKATHFVISQGVFFKDRKLVPAHWVKTVEEDKVELAVSSKLLEDLPAYEPQ